MYVSAVFVNCRVFVLTVGDWAIEKTCVYVLSHAGIAALLHKATRSENWPFAFRLPLPVST